MNTPKEQAQLTQDKLDGIEIEVRSNNRLGSKWYPMSDDYFNFQHNIYRRKSRKPRVIWLNDYPNIGFICSRGHNTQKDAEARTDNSCTSPVRFVEDLDWKGGEE